MKLIIAILAIAVLAALALYVYASPQLSLSPPEKITFENLPTTLKNNILVTRFPSDSSLSLRFYKDTPNNVEHEYIITKNSITIGDSDNVDITISLPSAYIKDLTTANLCDTLSQAKQNGKLTIQTDLSEKEIALKFWALIPEKSCLGL